MYTRATPERLVALRDRREHVIRRLSEIAIRLPGETAGDARRRDRRERRQLRKADNTALLPGGTR